MKKSFLALIILVCSLPSCTYDCDDTSIITKHFENDFGCENTKHDLVVDLINDYTIIRSKESYDNQVSGTCHPDINFSLFDLVIGKQSSGNWNDTIIYNLTRTCPEDELILTVDIIQSAATIPDNVVYHAIIPKLGDEEAINVKINLK